MIKNILVVCVGNICRSPMAEALLRRELAGTPGIKVHSAGLAAMVDNPAQPHAQALMRAMGLDISGHRARQLGPNLLKEAQLVLVMEAAHKAGVNAIDRTSRGKIYRLGEWRDLDIQDPYGRPREDYEHALTLIKVGVADWVNRIQN
jgi:protein-tyrosine phosphatase